MKKGGVLLILLVLSKLLCAQSVSVLAPPTFIKGKSLLLIKVVDSVSLSPLAGIDVQIKLCDHKLITLISDKSGNIYYDKGFYSDSLSFFIKSFKYKYVKHTHKIITQRISFLVKLTDSTIILPEIRVIDKKSLIKLKGDTTIYDAKAFRTMQGDPVKNLLQKMPGIVYQDGQIKAHGKLIRAIYLNGVSVFGSNINAALNLVKSDSVTSIEIYDSFSNKEKIVGDTLKSKGRVIDLKTKSKTQLYKQISTVGSIGDYALRSDTITKPNTKMYSILGSINRHRDGNNLVIQLGKGEKASSSANPTGKKTNEINGYLLWNYHPKDFKIHIISTNYINGNKFNDEILSIGQYTTPQQNDVFFKVNEQKNFTKKENIFSNNSLSYRLNKYETISIKTDFKTFISNTNNISKNEVSINDSPTYSLNLQQDGKIFNISFDNNIEYTIRLKNRSKISTGILVSYNKKRDNTLSIDTSLLSSTKVNLENKENETTNALSLYSNYFKQLNNNFRFIFDYKFRIENIISKMHSCDKIQSNDYYSAHPSFLPIYDYLFKRINNHVYTSLSYKKNRIEISGGIQMKISNQIDNNSIYQTSKKRNIIDILPNIAFSYASPTTRINFTYTENRIEPSINDLKDYIDKNNPSIIISGNPNLTQSEEKNLKFEFNQFLVTSSANITATIEAIFIDNSIATKVITFSKDTLIGNNKILAKAGSMIYSKENTNNKWNLNSNISYSKKLNFLSASMQLLCSYIYDKTPLLLENDAQYNSRHNLSSSFSMTTGFSRFIEINISHTISFEYSSISALSQTLKSILDNTSLTTRLNFCKNFWWNNNSTFKLYNANIDNANIDNAYKKEFIFDTSISYKFGKNKNGAILLAFNDIFDQSKLMNVTYDNSFINKTYSTSFGRNINLSLQYNF